MKTLLMAALAVATLAPALATSLPALAQDTPPYGAEAGRDRGDRMEPMDHAYRGETTEESWSLERREEWLSGRIESASAHGVLSGNEEQRGRDELRAIRAEQARLRERDGGRLSPEDHSYIARRLNQLNATLRWQGTNPPVPWADND